MIELKIRDGITGKLRKFKIRSEEVLERAIGRACFQLINFVVNGSPKNNTVPPIKTGLLRGSGSAFVANKFIGALPPVNGKGEPITAYNGKKNVGTVIFNTSYATKLHETTWTPNPESSTREKGVIGNKFLEKHLDTDREFLMKLITETIAKDMK